MLNLAFTGFFLFMLAAGLKRPFVWLLCYLYIDIVQPQVITWGFLSQVPVSLIAFVAAFCGWLMFDPKEDSRFTLRQGIMVLLLLYCGFTTITAVYPADAPEKWGWVWKALLFAIFMPLTLRTRLRIEAVALVMVLAASALIIDGGIKTVAGGSGYGTLRIFVDSNSGLFEGSIISAVAISIIPVAIWLAKYGTIFPSDWRVWTFTAALVFACALIPVGTQARTGLVCLVILCVLYLRTAKHRFLIAGAMALVAVIAVPFLPQSFMKRMDTIEDHRADQSASTRLAMWKWTWEYAKQHPFGGGFYAYQSAVVRYDTYVAKTTGGSTVVEATPVVEKGRAYHSSYFEMLGEQGYPGLALWLALQMSGLLQMEAIRRRWKDRKGPDEAWAAPMANALQLAQVVYLVGSLFVGIAFQPFILMLNGLQCGLWSYLKRIDLPRRKTGRKVPRQMRVQPVANAVPTA
ncbi:putative O-glycosylation ligase, exosortase A system-associated [Novosphingobium mangrovi (ex Huang et al. 2023)]|uniref:O-glycosylation ligase, exosortase A system-associated n=1 Tax=Novosphingobium mangrovi (ex Huang et al. 2023) TaxID=2976432 RepID=A0ABT2IAK1_9SPHN|nr:putative O-glycosylation ligase, exosortase A system-associated [Novosphingobium mangrovi (ex Huang et al. 2023)]MCT2401593.1 putative O-glycosylation ligase, exosortase A system-associated [Novosphingobium mangrovi (ex Huang et al. 2023)]